MITSFIKDLKLIKDTIAAYSKRNDGIPNSYYKIQKWLEQRSIKPFHIYDDLTVDISNDLFLNDENLTHIPLNLGVVNGNLELSNNALTNLKGIAKKIDGYLMLTNNPINNLDYLPQSVKGIIHINKVSEKEFRKFDNIEKFDSIHLYFKPGEAPEYFKKAQYKDMVDNYTFHLKEVLEISFEEFKSYMEKIKLEKILEIPQNTMKNQKVKI